MIGINGSRLIGRRRSQLQYSLAGGRSLIRMGARRFFDQANGTASVVLLRPMVVMAARAMGPGPARLRLVKLAHELNKSRLTVITSEPGFENAPVQPSTRAA